MENKTTSIFDEKLFINENGELTKLGLFMIVGCTIGCLHWLINNFVKKNNKEEK